MTEIWNLFRTGAQLSSHQKWQVHIQRCRYRWGSEGLTPSNQVKSVWCFTGYFQSTPEVRISPNTEKKPRLLSAAQDKGSTKSCRNHSGRATESWNDEKTRWLLVKTRTQQLIFPGIASWGSKTFFRRRLHGVHEQIKEWMSSSHSWGLCNVIQR